MLARLKAGDNTAWKELYGTVGPGLYNYILCIVRDREKAADILQEAFFKLAHGIHRIRKENAIKTWLYVTSRNLAYDSLRKTREILTNPYYSEYIEQIDPQDQPENVFIKNETRHELFQALEALPSLHREVIVLRLWGDLSFAEISRVTGDPVGTLRSRYCWAVRKLRQIMYKEVTRDEQ